MELTLRACTCMYIFVSMCNHLAKAGLANIHCFCTKWCFQHRLRMTYSCMYIYECNVHVCMRTLIESRDPGFADLKHAIKVLAAKMLSIISEKVGQVKTFPMTFWIMLCVYTKCGKKVPGILWHVCSGTRQALPVGPPTIMCSLYMIALVYNVYLLQWKCVDGSTGPQLPQLWWWLPSTFFPSWTCLQVVHSCLNVLMHIIAGGVTRTLECVWHL